MKIFSKLLPLFAGLIILISPGCKKEESYYPSKVTFNDFTGTWSGTLTAFKNNQLISHSGTILFFLEPDGEKMGGILSLEKQYALTEIQLRSGVFYFQVLNNDTTNPFCANWNLSGMAEITSEMEMHVIISGKECGEVGEEWINYEGDFVLQQPDPDSSKYFCFAGLGHAWTYNVQIVNNDSCQINTLINKNTGTVYSGLTSNSCNINWSSHLFRWDVTPTHFQVLDNTNGNKVQYAFHFDQDINVPYYYYYGNDTNIVTRLGSDSVYVAAGGFLCTKYRLDQYLHTDSTYRIDKGVLYIDNVYGLIRYQSTLLNDYDDFVTIELAQKNF
ncbi:MAG TPA: hypothetical protein PKJ28_05675 [Bacteroidales bacterium]|nr:hypothetical protein [Bacteroidales bacterium]HPS73851.1 hypothetical protein [Bacteroidales bacterium]